MIYRLLGRTGISVSAISLGCEGFAAKTLQEAQQLMDAAIRGGVNFIDIYASNPELRSLIGNVLAGHKEEFFIQGHIGAIWKNGQYERTRNVEESRIAFEDLLTRLNRRCIEIGMIHYVDEIEDFHHVFNGEFINYVKELKRSGKIRFIGLSSHNPTTAKMAVKTGLIDVLMFSVNPCYDMQPPNENVEMLWADEQYAGSLHNFNREREELYELCEQENVAIDVMKVYAGGDLLKSDLSPFGKAFTPVQAMNYALTRPAVAAVMTGVKNIDELKAALQWNAASESEKDYSQVLSSLEQFTWSGHCMYCGHCAPCPSGICVADVNKYLNLALAHGVVTETVREHYKLLSRHADNCVQCGACEARCPFQVPIRQKMRQAVEIFNIKS